MKRLVPELALRLCAQNPLADAGQRGRDDKGADKIGHVARYRLSDPAADVVTGDHGPDEPEFPDEPGYAASLRGGRVLAGRIGVVLVGPVKIGRASCRGRV